MGMDPGSREAGQGSGHNAEGVGQHGGVISSPHARLLGTALEKAEGGIWQGLVSAQWAALRQQVPLPFLGSGWDLPLRMEGG